MKHTLVVLFLLTAVPFIMGAGKGEDRKLVDGIVATVNGDAITLYQLDQRAQILRQKFPDVTDIKKLALDDLINEDIIYNELNVMGVTIDKQEIRNTIEQMSEANGVSMDALKVNLKNKGIHFDAYEDEIRSEIAKSRLVSYKFRSEITITDDDIQRYYLEHKSSFSMVKQADISHILIAVPPGSSGEEIARLKEKAGKAAAAVRKGMSFTAAAARYSDDRVTAHHGGQLGYVEQGTLYPVIDKAIFSAIPGSIEGPIRTPVGYEIIKVNGFQSSELLPLKDVKNRIRNAIFESKLDYALKSWLLTKRQKTIITVYSEFI